MRIFYLGPVGGGPVAAILYILDPEPELFALTCAHLLCRVGYDDIDMGTTPLHHMAVVGVGHHPNECLCADAAGRWDVSALRALRRRDFLGRDTNAAASFLTALCDHVVPAAENYMGLDSTTCNRCNRRALLGCSLSSLVGLRALFTRPKVFGRLILGSPSLPLSPEAFVLEQRGIYAAEACEVGVRVVFFVGELEGGLTGGNGIPSKAREMADALKRRGVLVSPVHAIVGEDHSSVKPSIVSRGLTWLDESWKAELYSGASQAAAMPSAVLIRQVPKR